ncbi:Uncharacterised protein [BD1-7 clade bacterium]|uniref:Putative adhesin Stv domain-containing protein n=1 Tax=BD1-7 clade bacterium TaxID=2029982 RepID=A0A5S9R096_9GAMM|nr:Uncharacterised protein [BD1-7 clade bacterium]
MARAQIPGFVTVYHDNQLTLFGTENTAPDSPVGLSRPQHAVIVGQGCVVDNDHFILPNLLKEIRFLAPDGYRLFSSLQLLRHLGDARKFDALHGGASCQDIELRPLSIGSKADNSRLLAETDSVEWQVGSPSYDIISVNCPLRFKELLHHPEILRYQTIDIHVCRCEQVTGPMYFLDIPSVPADQLKFIDWQVF